VENIRAGRCSRCHVSPQPRTRDRKALEEVRIRHVRRVRLTAQEWQAMIDYLATPNGATSPEPLGQ
jgi:hypothetical protein